MTTLTQTEQLAQKEMATLYQRHSNKVQAALEHLSIVARVYTERVNELWATMQIEGRSRHRPEITEAIEDLGGFVSAYDDGNPKRGKCTIYAKIPTEDPSDKDKVLYHGKLTPKNWRYREST